MEKKFLHSEKGTKSLPLPQGGKQSEPDIDTSRLLVPPVPNFGDAKKLEWRNVIKAAKLGTGGKKGKRRRRLGQLGVDQTIPAFAPVVQQTSGVSGVVYQTHRSKFVLENVFLLFNLPPLARCALPWRPFVSCLAVLEMNPFASEFHRFSIRGAGGGGRGGGGAGRQFGTRCCVASLASTIVLRCSAFVCVASV